jgi:class 3 adenylate cyclase
MRCPSCGEDNPDRARFCLACGTELAEPSAPASESRRVVTIVFADMAGSTAIGERLDPEALRRVQARYFDTLTVAIERHGGTVEKYIGDAVMAVFGIPRLHEDDPLRAVRAAHEMQRLLDTLNDSLERDHGVRIQVRIGVHTGEVVTGDPSAGQRLVTGDAVNVAARLEQAAGAGRIVLSEATHRLVKDAVRAERLPPLDLRGKREPVEAVQLLEVLPDTAGHVRNLDAPIVGRDKELELLRRALERALDERTSHLFTLLGPAGVGKSRLVREFLDSAGDVRIVQGRCLSYGEGITYYAVAQIVRDAAGLGEGVDRERGTATIRAVVEGLDAADEITEALTGVLGWREPATPEDTAWATRKLFEHLARDRPLIVVIDDLHWAEPLLLDLVEHVADWTRDAPVLLLIVARPELLELRPGWGGGKLNATAILLEALSGGAADELLDNLLGTNDLPTAARQRILAAAEGNPLFVEEMVGMLIDDGLLRFDGSMWRAAEDLADLTVPPTIHLLLTARLDRLDAEERAVIERGAVEGKVFHAGAVSSLIPEPLRAQVRPRLLTLARKELIRPDRAEFAGEDAFRFRHLLIRDAAYHAMSKEQRADLHERFAAWLERAAGPRAEDYLEILAHHLEQAWRYRRELGREDEPTRALGSRAAAALRRAAERSSLRGDVTVGLHQLERGLEMVGGAEHLAMLADLAELRYELNAYREATEAALDAGASRDPLIRMRAEIVRLAASTWIDPTFRHETVRARLEELRERALAVGSQELADRCDLFIGLILFFGGRTDGYREIAMRLLPRVHEMKLTDRRAVGFGLASSMNWGPLPVDQAWEVPDLIEGIYEHSLLGKARAHMLRLALSAMADDERGFEEARATVETLHRELGTEHVPNPQLLLESLWRLRRTDEAVRVGLATKAIYDRTGEMGANATLTPLTAYYAIEASSPDLAERLLVSARAMASPDDFASHVPISWVSALLASEAGDHGRAIAAIEPALATIRETDYVTFEAETERVYGKVLAAAGRDAEATAAFDRALALFDRKGDVASARRLRAELSR